MVFTGLLVFYLKPVPYLPANYKKKRLIHYNNSMKNTYDFQMRIIFRAMEMRKSKRHSSRSASLGSKSSQTTLFTAGVEIETRRITTTTTQHSRHGSTTSIPMTDLNFCGSGPPSAVLPSELGPTVEVSNVYTAIQSICTINNVIFTMEVKLESNFKHMIGLLIVVDFHSNISFYQLLQY